jgi:hypothetical protein
MNKFSGYFLSNFSINSIYVGFIVLNLAGCSSQPSVPSKPLMPQTPPQFLAQTREPTDRSLNCKQMIQKIRYTIVMNESLDRIFDAKGPVLMQESSYTSINGMAVRSGNLTNVYSSSKSYGGGSVYVYSELSYRAKQIKEAQQNRRKELQYLVKASGCNLDLRSSGSGDYSHYIRQAESDFRSASNEYQSWSMAVVESKNLLARTDIPEMKKLIKEDLEDRIRTRDKAKEDTDTAKIRLDALVAESKEAYARAEHEVSQMLRWFEQNTNKP